MAEKIRSCPLSDWPTADREAWQQAGVAAQRLRSGGAAARVKPSTRTSLVRAYGYLLDFCRRNGLFDQNAVSSGHVTPKIIDAFVRDLRGRVGSVTRATYIERIRRIAKILAPVRDLGWLREIEGDLRYEARPRPKYHRIVSSDRLLALGLELISRGETSNHLTDLARARLVRDGLMIAFLSLCPIRLRNLAELRVGRQLRRIGDTWWIILEVAETKSGRPDERPAPEPRRMGIASGLLQHSDQRTVEKHYNKGATIGAVGKWSTLGGRPERIIGITEQRAPMLKPAVDRARLDHCPARSSEKQPCNRSLPRPDRAKGLAIGRDQPCRCRGLPRAAGR